MYLGYQIAQLEVLIFLISTIQNVKLPGIVSVSGVDENDYNYHMSSLLMQLVALIMDKPLLYMLSQISMLADVFAQLFVYKSVDIDELDNANAIEDSINFLTEKKINYSFNVDLFGAIFDAYRGCLQCSR